MEKSKELGLGENVCKADREEEREDEGKKEGNGEDENRWSSSSISVVTSPSAIPRSFPSSTPDLQTIVDVWSKAVGHNPDVAFRVHEDYFHLHREPMAARSRFLRRHLSADNEVRVSPPLKITFDTFTDVARFCYTGSITLTPSNLAALAVAAELLEMDEDDEDWSLVRQAEAYFKREIAGDEEKAEDVLSRCLEAGEAAERLAASFVEVFRKARENCSMEWTANLLWIPVDALAGIMKWMASWSEDDHNALYAIADNYLEAHSERLTEQEKLSICEPIDSTKLSDDYLLLLARNSLLPLRFKFEALLLSRSTANTKTIRPTGWDLNDNAAAAAAHQASRLSIRIESLECEVAALRRRLHMYEEKQHQIESAGRTKSSGFLQEEQD